VGRWCNICPTNRFVHIIPHNAPIGVSASQITNPLRYFMGTTTLQMTSHCSFSGELLAAPPRPVSTPFRTETPFDIHPLMVICCQLVCAPAGFSKRRPPLPRVDWCRHVYLKSELIGTWRLKPFAYLIS